MTDDVEIPPEIPLREYAPPHIPDFCPDTQHLCTRCCGSGEVVSAFRPVRCILCNGTGWEAP
jgi:DnaJ-class molecular chaperone